MTPEVLEACGVALRKAAGAGFSSVAVTSTFANEGSLDVAMGLGLATARELGRSTAVVDLRFLRDLSGQS